MADRCHWVRCEDGTEVLIPRCWAAVLDPAACTCEVDGSRLERAEYARFSAEQEVLRLRGKLDRAAARYEESLFYQRRQYREINRLRAALAAVARGESR